LRVSPLTAIPASSSHSTPFLAPRPLSHHDLPPGRCA
jgi:hypothetical protein